MMTTTEVPLTLVLSNEEHDVFSRLFRVNEKRHSPLAPDARPFDLFGGNWSRVINHAAVKFGGARGSRLGTPTVKVLVRLDTAVVEHLRAHVKVSGRMLEDLAVRALLELLRFQQMATATVRELVRECSPSLHTEWRERHERV